MDALRYILPGVILLSVIGWPAAPVRAADCPEGVCVVKPDCEAEGLTEDECEAYDDSQSRGRVEDVSRTMDRAPPENSEQLMPDETFTLWVKDEVQFRPATDDKVVYETRIVEEAETIKLTDVVPPVRFEQGSSEIPREFIDQLRDVLADMQHRENVRLHVIGHTDNTPLSPSNRALYGDNVGLSEARARMAAEFFQRALGLPAESVSYEGKGANEAIASNATEQGRRRNRRVEVEVWYDEITETTVQEEATPTNEFKQIKVCRVVERCIYKRRVGDYQKIQLINAVPPLRYEGTQVQVSEAFIGQVARALNDVSDMPNVTLRVVAHTDNQPLTGGAERIYGDKISLSKALANRVARELQERFRIENNAVTTIGEGETEPVATNATAAGRAQNRRIEVEVWHDDPRGQQVSEPRACPGDAEAEMVTMLYEDEQPLVPFKGGSPDYPNGFFARVQRILNQLSDTKENVRINFVGHTTNERLSRRAAAVYGDHFKLSESRAERVMEYVSEELGLTEEQIMTEGRGFVDPLNKPDDSPFARRTFSTMEQERAVNPRDARVELEFLYDEVAEVERDPNLEIIPTQVDEPPVSPFALHPIRVTVDGETLDQSRRHTADMQRCVDVAMDQSDLKLRYDSLDPVPRLNVQAVPPYVTYWDDPDTRVMENKIGFKAYSNYDAYIQRAEVRIHEADKSLQTEPLEVIPLNEDYFAEWWWIPEVEPFEGPVKQLKYVLRVYDEEGNYDETAPKPIWVLDRIKSAETFEQLDLPEEQNVIYGESHLAKRNIPLEGGTVTVTGDAVPVGRSVWVMGQAVPLSDDGDFVAEQIVPEGYHTTEVAVLDEEGNGNLYLRDLELEKSDWFTMGIADLVLGKDSTNGPADLVTQDDTYYNSEFWAYGRAAFYTKGQTENDWTITASADTREEPIDEMFTNLDKKDPDSLFRRMDPDYYYPTFGDDSTTIEDAPTSGRFYVKAEKNKSYGMWGNFNTDITDTDLAQIDRALYGANMHYESLAITDYGESDTKGDLFVAEPGTILSRDEFRGTGGSLYFLQNRDITQGSERLRIEIRDRDSGIVIETRTLVFGEDYDIDYIQGRILLNRPLPSTADDNLLVSDGAVSGHPVFLVARYEYTPGFEEIEDTTTGGRISHWFGNHFKMGATVSNEEQLGETQELTGVDVTWRQTPETYIKVESAQSEGPGFGQSFSGDGGYRFSNFDYEADPNQSAGANRIEAAADLDDLFDVRGSVNLYNQTREAGFSAPGQLTNTEVTQTGATVDVPIGDRWDVYTKLDSREQQDTLSTQSGEVDVRYQLNQHWRFSSGLRSDRREDNRQVVPDTQTQGKRDDMAVEALYDSREGWKTYGFVQGTLDTTETRRSNDRVGVGGALQLTDRFTMDAEISDGDLGSGGKLGLDYLATDRTNIYMAYLVDTDRSDIGQRGRNGRSTLGFRTRYSDTTSVYGEERYSFGEQPTGLTHAYGVDISPADNWTFGVNMESGTLEDYESGAETERNAYGFSAGYGSETFKLSSALELREDETESYTRETNLLKSNMAVQLNPSWRTTLKLNRSESDSSQGEFYDGDFTEFVWGYAYRPVYHDRLNMLVKFTYFENMPSADQQAVRNTRTEFIQRSNVYSIDATYDLTQRWTLGAKYGRRDGEVALDRANPEFFESNANLYVVRADWHVVRTWDWLIEGRALEVEQAQDQRSGFLTALYKHFGDNIKVGAGYNFTDFSDDLTDLDFDSQGVFINIVGKM